MADPSCSAPPLSSLQKLSLESSTAQRPSLAGLAAKDRKPTKLAALAASRKAKPPSKLQLRAQAGASKPVVAPSPEPVVVVKAEPVIPGFSLPPPPATIAATPSVFASAFSAVRQSLVRTTTWPEPTPDAFAGPSPDDVVLKARTGTQLGRPP